MQKTFNFSWISWICHQSLNNHHPFKMAEAPSPLIPLLLVVAFGLLLRGNVGGLILDIPLVLSDTENAVFLCVLLVPFTVLLAIYSNTYTIAMPILFAMVIYAVTATLLGPLVLILVVYLTCTCLPCFNCNGEELGWVCLVGLGFLLMKWVVLDEGRQWGVLALAVTVYLCYHFLS